MGARLSERDRQAVEATEAFLNGSFDEAERITQTIVDNHPSDAEGWFTLGTLILHTASLRGRTFDGAKKCYDRAVDLGYPDMAAFVHHRGWLAGMEGRRDDYADLLDMYLERFPQSFFAPQTHAMRAYLN